MLRFPFSFAFGTATAATQIEGGCTSTDWWAFSHRLGRVAHGDTTDVACDHYNRVAEDIALQSRLGMNAHRLSVEWGRIEPERGRFDDDALEHYRREVRLLREAGIEPMVTLHHFSFPTWLAEVGGCTADELPAAFERFTRTVVRALSDHVNLWITINEPNVMVAQGYLFGIWPPGKPSPRDVPRAIRRLRRAHRAAYRAIHEVTPSARVGLAHHVRLAVPATDKLADRGAARLLDAAFNRPFLDLPQDFVGLNYYSRDVVRFDRKKGRELFVAREVAEGAPVNELGWEIYPDGLGARLAQPRPRNACPFGSPRTASPITPTRCVRGSSSIISGKSRSPSTRASTCAATCTGRCSTTSSGPKATALASACMPSTTRRRPARLARAPRSTPTSPALAGCE